MLQSPSVIEPGLASIPNPFSDAAVGSAWETTLVDVPGIHADVSTRLMQIISERARGHRHRCIMLYGDAGSGKTHILRRLRIQLEKNAGPVVPFSWIRMQTSPSMMWRHVRRSLADDLARRPFRGSTQLAHLLETRAESIHSVEDRDLAIVLEHIAGGRFTRDARAWLAGSILPEAALHAMWLAFTDGDEEHVEDSSRRIVYGLAGFPSPSPLVLCLDQLEALQSYPGDKNGLFAIGKLLAALHDEAPNVVVIGCVQTGLIADLALTLSKAETDRYQPIALRPLNSNEVRSLVQARLESQPDLRDLRPADAPELWPIDVSKLDPLVQSREGISARKVIFECDQLFRAAQELPAEAAALEDRLVQGLEERLSAAASVLSGDTSSLVLSDSLPRLLHLRGSRIDRSGMPKWMDHILKRSNGREVAVVLANENPRSLWRKLDRICLGWDPKQRDMAILRDAMHPIPLSSTGAIERLHELERRGARILTPSREALVALDAVRRLLADADSGDLTWRGDKVPVSTVEQWVRNHLAEPAERVLTELDGPQPPEASAALRLALGSLLAEYKVVSVAGLAEQLHCTSQEVENCARQNTDQFGFLDGNEPAVFERIPSLPGA